MLLKRLPRPQSSLSAWTARKSGSVQQRASNSTDRALKRKERERAAHSLSLFEELFPGESKPPENVQKPANALRNSRGPLRDELLRDFDWAISKDPRGSRDPAASARTDEDGYRERRDASVLILTNASKNLSLSDFLRLSPKGEHIDGWASGIIKVIPGRDAQTLEPQGHYFILFSTDAAARAYMDKVVRLQTISKTYTPTSITSPLAPPPGYLKNGEDLHALMQAFTLIPSSHQSVSIRMLKKPFQPAMQRMIAEGGHPGIAKRQSKSEDMVLFSLDKGYVSFYDLRAALGRDGKERNLQWNLLQGDDDIVKLDTKKEAELEEDEDKDGQRRKRRAPPRYIISFKDNQEARRFVREWHRRPFPLSQERQNPEDEAPPIVNAELLW